jgi:hypothetical protein
MRLSSAAERDATPADFGAGDERHACHRMIHTTPLDLAGASEIVREAPLR